MGEIKFGLSYTHCLGCNRKIPVWGKVRPICDKCHNKRK